jgi:hypothetical protein
MSKTFELSEPERQLIEIIREGGDLRIVLMRTREIWDVKLSATLKTIDGGHKRSTVRGLGPTFDLAWEETEPISGPEFRLADWPDRLN